MGGILSSPKPSAPPEPDTSLIDAQRKEKEDQKAKVERENKARRRNLRGAGGRPALLFGTAQGVFGSGGAAPVANLSKTIG